MTLTNEKLKKDVIDQLYWDSSVDASQIKVEVADGVVTLTGTVPSYGNRIAAESDAWAVRGIRDVRNDLIVRLDPPETPQTDADIQRNVSSLLAWTPDIVGLDIQVTVQNGEVTLEGVVDQFWKKWKAENLVHNLSGVIDVVNHLTVVPTEDVVDKEIAMQIENALDRDAHMFADEVTVEVEDGKVSLTGTVPSWYARWRAFDIAAVTPGVTHVDHELEIA